LERKEKGNRKKENDDDMNGKWRKQFLSRAKTGIKGSSLQ
jgi:hypothetical protein